MAEYGHIKISRKAFLAVDEGGDVFWNEKRAFSRWEAWQYMIQAAAWRGHDIALKGGGVIRVQRGETPPLSVRFLMKAWGWGSPKRVLMFLGLLEERHQISNRQRTASGNTYLLVNYDAYQGDGNTDGNTSGNADGTAAETPAETKQKQEEAKEAKSPRKRRASARESWDTWKPKDGHAELATAQGLDLAVQESMFRDHFIGNGKPLHNRDAAFRNWLRRAKSFETNGRTLGKPRTDSRRTDGQAGRDPEGARTRPSKYEHLVKRGPAAAGG